MIFEKFCKFFGLKDVNAELLFVDSAEIQELNRKYMGKNKPTDVLSFPNLNIKPGESLNNFPLDINPESNKLELGSVVICKDYAQLPIDFLAVHGFLHLLGYDHATEADEKIMNELTERILCKKN